LLDDPVRDVIRAKTPEGRETAARISDYLYWGMFAYPVIVDSGIVAGLIHRDFDVAWETGMASIQAQGASGLVSVWSLALVGRERPLGRGCAEDPNYDPACGTSTEVQSFFSGHTTAAFTTAGLMCVHHEYIPLYGGGAAEPIACATSIVLATTVGALRIVADRHYLSDVLVGAAVGFSAGYFLPKLLHYEWPSDEGEGVVMNVQPAGPSGSAGLSLGGRF
jgi:membrane-associated phospholipid phosphatase